MMHHSLYSTPSNHSILHQIEPLGFVWKEPHSPSNRTPWVCMERAPKHHWFFIIIIIIIIIIIPIFNGQEQPHFQILSTSHIGCPQHARTRWAPALPELPMAHTCVAVGKTGTYSTKVRALMWLKHCHRPAIWEWFIHVYTTYFWWFGGRFIIVWSTLHGLRISGLIWIDMEWYMDWSYREFLYSKPWFLFWFLIRGSWDHRLTRILVGCTPSWHCPMSQAMALMAHHFSMISPRFSQHAVPQTVMLNHHVVHSMYNFMDTLHV